ncbi:MAG: hypothetical protein NTV31_04820 [Bacteroidia bacterium]|nr:hypothetical protein [Bacteroidia bacterium]
MKFIKRFIYSVIILQMSLLSFICSSQIEFPEGYNFTSDEKQLIIEKSISLLSEFETLINVYGNPDISLTIKTNTFRPAIFQLFTYNVELYNDLSMETGEESYLKLDSVLNYILRYYPYGINQKFILDKAFISEILKSTDDSNQMTLAIVLHKSIKGYLAKNNIMIDTITKCKVLINFYSGKDMLINKFRIRSIEKMEEKGCISGNCHDGDGIFIYDDNSKYNGHWVMGKFDGYGIYYLNNGDRYEGNWSQGNYSGMGTYYSNGSKYYEGEWKNNMMNGSGIIYNSENNPEYQGIWRNDTLIEKYISGYLNYCKSGYDVSGAEIYYLDRNGLKQETESNLYGNFSLLVPVGVTKLIVNKSNSYSEIITINKDDEYSGYTCLEKKCESWKLSIPFFGPFFKSASIPLSAVTIVADASWIISGICAIENYNNYKAAENYYFHYLESYHNSENYEQASAARSLVQTEHDEMKRENELLVQNQIIFYSSLSVAFISRVVLIILNSKENKRHALPENIEFNASLNLLNNRPVFAFKLSF